MDTKKTKCGLIMPISSLGEYSIGHWETIKRMLSDVVKDADLGEKTELVSYDDVIPNINRRIYKHIFSLPIIICDVSGNNPNVLYELGLRVAFDMPIIIVKDKKTKFNFDLKDFEHLIYPDEIDPLGLNDEAIKFKELLKRKLISMDNAYGSKSKFFSPLENSMDHEDYLKIKRGSSVDIEGTYEYICNIRDVGYSHGGLCKIQLVNSYGNLTEWHLRGKRYWTKIDNNHSIERFAIPYRWETNKAVVFPDKSFMVSYSIKTNDKNIFGFINGSVETEGQSELVRLFIGEFHQDEGSKITKGQFNMFRIPETVEVKSYEFTSPL